MGDGGNSQATASTGSTGEGEDKVKTKYVVLGKSSVAVTVLRYGVCRDANNAIHRLRDAERGNIKPPSKRIKIYRYLHSPKDTEFGNFWIEDESTSNNVTKKLLVQFIHDPVNRKRKKMIMWATEEVIRRGEGR